MRTTLHFDQISDDNKRFTSHETEELEGVPCDWCGGSGMEGIDPRTFDPITCRWCKGSGVDPEGEATRRLVPPSKLAEEEDIAV